jgi:hypothetical protein
MGYVLQQNILFLQKPKKLLRSVWYWISTVCNVL